VAVATVCTLWAEDRDHSLTFLTVHGTKFVAQAAVLLINMSQFQKEISRKLQKRSNVKDGKNLHIRWLDYN
jgi:hypothetical protein